MRIAVTGEGPTDYGKVDYGNPGHWIDDPVQVYLRRIAEEQKIELDFEMIERAEVQKIKLQRRHLNGLDGKAVPARRFYTKCKEKQLNYGVYYCDADRVRYRKITYIWSQSVMLTCKHDAAAFLVSKKALNSSHLIFIA